MKQLGKVRPDLRNPILATIVESLNKAEKSLFWNIHKIRNKRIGITRTYIQNRNEFVVILYNKEIEEEGINTIENKILKFCKE